MQSSPHQLEQTFQRIRDEAGWDLSKPMLWGFFFTDHLPARLEAAANVLTSQGYHFVAIYEPDIDAAVIDSEAETAKAPLYFLHIERVELNTPASLHARNGELNALATEFDLSSYDGWDVGIVPPPPPTD